MDATIIIVEIKSSVADFRADTKWREYRAHCDKFYFAIPASMPVDIIPDDAVLILADAYAGSAGSSHRPGHPPRNAHALCAYGGATPASLERFRRSRLGAVDALFGLMEFSSDKNKNKLVISTY